METQLFTQIASTGVVGVLLVVVLLAYRQKDRELKEEQQARIADAKSYLDLAMKLQEQVIIAVQKLSEIVEYLEKQDRPKETRESAGRRGQ